jgi:hypothetical protein
VPRPGIVPPPLIERGGSVRFSRWPRAKIVTKPRRKAEKNPELRSLSVPSQFVLAAVVRIAPGHLPHSMGEEPTDGVGKSVSKAELGGEFAHHRAIVKLQDAIPYQLIIFMPFAGDYNHVAGAREAKRDRNRAAPIRFHDISG